MGDVTRGQRLSIGATSKSWTIFWTLLAPLALVPPVISLVLVLIGQGTAAFVLLAFPAVVGPAVLVRGLQERRKAFWLDGPVLIQRRVRGYAECDLRTARFALHRSAITMSGRPEPRLLIVRPPGQAAIRLPLGTSDDPLRPPPPHELEALIRAVSANRTDPNAPGIARHLGQLTETW
ncbi:hypothetical protein [Actinomadura geliboluensis]|uniref:Uncharacterized protein n=2 Tax=Actinomadura geliboluensis TaxID=882440 RepID=A0A5S4GML1_9ACTN|nr:hypothetical protein [Actinomadura geliboluensis]TMR34188.1 hypothetical protein ETD96_25775 [Actinomadura geliboluensis]